MFAKFITRHYNTRMMRLKSHKVYNRTSNRLEKAESDFTARHSPTWTWQYLSNSIFFSVFVCVCSYPIKHPPHCIMPRTHNDQNDQNRFSWILMFMGQRGCGRGPTKSINNNYSSIIWYVCVLFIIINHFPIISLSMHDRNRFTHVHIPSHQCISVLSCCDMLGIGSTRLEASVDIRISKTRSSPGAKLR